MPGHKVIRKFSTLWRSSAPWPRNRGSQNNSGTACVRLRNHRQRHLVAKWDWPTSSVGVKPIYHQPSTINRIMSDTYVPLISSGVAGPLGVLQLPRMWQKVSLEAAGKLASGYPGIGRGFDAMTCASLGLEEQTRRITLRRTSRPILSSKRG